MTIPTVIFSFIGVGISTTYIPIYSDILEEKGKKQGLLFSNSLINLSLVLSTIFVLIGLLFTEQIINISISKHRKHQKDQVI